MAREVEKNAPDLSASNARFHIVGYIYGVTPGLAIPIVFGLTGPFRKTLYETFVPRRWQNDIYSQEKPMGQAGPWGVRAADTAVTAPYSLQRPKYRFPGRVESRPATPGQDRSGRSNTGLPTASEEDLYELGIGAGAHVKQPEIARLKVTAIRPGLS
ncbi:hypothetical protein VPNG_03031 [Cytospora leucostoma]|uniref:Uncharacterized protein n=1 Tax=Cytospora leucostoma TaxID=1230097 RepID=A0A423XG21_9PEZI|nr:hypothetical protein VPNG_03031 [Cytospora leucostoma]